MEKPLEKIIIQCCEWLPLNFTFFEEKGFCTKNAKNCQYCKEYPKDTYHCHKQTYTPIPELGFD